jgi:hypothetical protein
MTDFFQAKPRRVSHHKSISDLSRGAILNQIIERDLHRLHINILRIEIHQLFHLLNSAIGIITLLAKGEATLESRCSHGENRGDDPSAGHWE